MDPRTNAPDIHPDVDQNPPKKPFDRAEHCRQIAHLGGKRRAEIYPPEVLSMWAKKGFEAAMAKYDYTPQQLWALINAQKGGQRSFRGE